MSGWFENLAGPTLGPILMWIVILGLLVALFFGLYWLFRHAASGTFIAGGRNRKPRLAVLDAAAVDSRRRIVLVRRDDVEHLIMIGGQSDLVIEQGIRRKVIESGHLPKNPSKTEEKSREPVARRPQPAAIPAEPVTAAATIATGAVALSEARADTSGAFTGAQVTEGERAETEGDAARHGEPAYAAPALEHPEPMIYAGPTEPLAPEPVFTAPEPVFAAPEPVPAAPPPVAVEPEPREPEPFDELKIVVPPEMHAPFASETRLETLGAAQAEAIDAPHVRAEAEIETEEKLDFDTALLRELETTLEANSDHRAEPAAPEIDETLSKLIAEMGRSRR